MERTHEKYERLIERCRGLDPIACAVVHPCDESSLRGALEAAQDGLIVPVLVGPEPKIRRVAAECRLDLTGLRIVNAPHSEAAADAACGLAREGKVDALMKGSLHTDELMMVGFAFEKGAVGATHSHPHVQASYVAEGSFEVTVDGVTETLRAGSSFIVPSNAVHGVRALETGRLVDTFTPHRADFL